MERSALRVLGGGCLPAAVQEQFLFSMKNGTRQPASKGKRKDDYERKGKRAPQCNTLV